MVIQSSTPKAFRVRKGTALRTIPLVSSDALARLPRRWTLSRIAVLFTEIPALRLNCCSLESRRETEPAVADTTPRTPVTLGTAATAQLTLRISSASNSTLRPPIVPTPTIRGSTDTRRAERDGRMHARARTQEGPGVLLRRARAYRRGPSRRKEEGIRFPRNTLRSRPPTANRARGRAASAFGL